MTPTESQRAGFLLPPRIAPTFAGKPRFPSVMADLPTSSSTPRTHAEHRHLQLATQESLRKRLVARDERALVELIDVATPWLLGVAEGILRDGSEAEEVVLESFRRVWDQVGTITDTRAGLMPWLLRVTRNLAIDRVRARRRRFDTEVALAAELVYEAVRGPEPIVEAGVPGTAANRAVHDAIGALTQDQAHAVRLAFFSGLSHSEIALALGVPLGTVKSRLRLAFDKLRASLSGIRDWAV